MLQDAHHYMTALTKSDELHAALEKAIFDTRTPDDLVHDLRVRRKQLQDVKGLITGAHHDLPHS